MESEDYTDISGSEKIASIIESNCEYLTFLRHNMSNRTNTARNSLKTLEEYIKHSKHKINYPNLLQVIIELAYFMYACKTYHITPFIDSQDIRVEQSTINFQTRFSLIFWYKVEDEGIEEGDAMQMFIKLFEYIQDGLKISLKEEKEEEGKNIEEEEDFHLFRSQFNMLANCNFNKETLFFLSLEQTALFYQKSILYRIKNCSILDFIKTNQKKLNLFRVSKVSDQILLVQLSKLKKGLENNEQQQCMQKQKQIIKNIRGFFKQINQQYYYQPQSDYSIIQMKFNFTLHQRPKYSFQEMLESMQGANVFRTHSKNLMICKRIPTEIQYFVQYFPSSNRLTVKLYNHSIFQNAQITDFILFRSNVFSFESLNISVELSQPRNTSSSNKELAFIGNSQFITLQSSLQKILLLMDMTMMVSKIYESEIKKNKNQNNIGKDYQRLKSISKKINHYIKLFVKCAKKIYNE